MPLLKHALYTPPAIVVGEQDARRRLFSAADRDIGNRIPVRSTGKENAAAQAKRLNAAARCMAVYQQGLLALHKVRQRRKRQLGESIQCEGEFKSFIY